MENSYTKYLEIIDDELIDHIEELIRIENWIKKRIEKDRDFKYGPSLDLIHDAIKELKKNL